MYMFVVCCILCQQRFKQNLKANVRPGTEFFDGVPTGEPAWLAKKPPRAAQKPLQADVLRAFDSYKDKLSEAASSNAAGGGGGGGAWGMKNEVLGYVLSASSEICGPL